MRNKKIPSLKKEDIENNAKSISKSRNINQINSNSYINHNEKVTNNIINKIKKKK